MSSRQEEPSSGSRRSNGRTIGQFIMRNEIGKGSFAQVYLGWHKVRRWSCLPSSHAFELQSHAIRPYLRMASGRSHYLFECLCLIAHECCVLFNDINAEICMLP